MESKNWINDDPTKKQKDLFNSLKSIYGYHSVPKTKGEYREALNYLLKKQATESAKFIINKSNSPMRNNDWMNAYDDDYLGDQGIFPGY